MYNENRAWYCGGFKVHIITENKSKEATLIYPMEKVTEATMVEGEKGNWFKLDPTHNTAYWVKSNQVSATLNEELKVGDYVEAIYKGNQGFKGVITAVEGQTNVVCRSVNGYDRCRFSYDRRDLRKVSKKSPASAAIRAIEVDGEIQFVLFQ